MSARAGAPRHVNGHCRPFLKWAGNKYRIIERIRALLPPGRRLVEPFAGSAAVFLNTDYARYLIVDSNADLINLYRILQAEGEDFIRYCRRLFGPGANTPETYYRRRDEFNATGDPRRKAALFVYLNRHGYNGLCRYNARGGFNVPFGRYRRPYFPAAEMRAFHARAHRARFVHADFTWAFAQLREDDVVYCDPPYAPLSPSASFTGYSAGGFGLDQQERLAKLAEAAARRGVPVLISNHNTSFTRRIYGNATRCERFQVQRYISCNARRRHEAGELLALYG